MKTLYSHILSLLLVFSFVLFVSCSDNGNPTGPDPKNYLHKVLSVELKSDNLIDGKKYSLNAEGLGTILNITREYYLHVIYEHGTQKFIKEGLTVTISNPDILKFTNCKVTGKAVGETDITLTYPEKDGYEGFEYKTKGWTYQFSVTGRWSIYKLVNSEWLYDYDTIIFYDIPEQKAFGPAPNWPQYFYESAISNTYIDQWGNTGVIENENTIFRNMTDGSQYKYKKI